MAEPDDGGTRLGAHAHPPAPSRLATWGPHLPAGHPARRGHRRLRLRSSSAGHGSAELASRQPCSQPGPQRLGRHRPAGTQRGSGADRPTRADRGPEARAARRPPDPGTDALGGHGWTARDADDRLHQRRRALQHPRFDRRRGGRRRRRRSPSRCARDTARRTSCASRSPSPGARSSTSATWRPARTRSATRPVERHRSPSPSTDRRH